MKKYLVMAAMAVAVCGVFIGCSDDEITPATIEQRKLAFEDAFIHYYGQPDPNHTWGFGKDDETETRSVDVNGNMWESCPSLAEGEAQAVYNWVNRPKNQIPTNSYAEVSPVDLKNFFVTQVWGKNENTNDANCHYTNYDNGNVFGSEKMNHLQISKSAARLGTDGVASVNAAWNNPGGDAINSDWDHAYNFNAASNQDWNGNTMFVNWGTKNFAYHNSENSRYYDKWIIVDGYYITEDHRFADKYYVCFDYISTNPEAYTNFQEPGVGNVTVPGAWKTVNDAIGQTASNGHTVAANWSKGNIVGGNKIVDANEYYTDWIIRLVEARPKNQEVPQVKIITSTGKIRKEVFTQSTAIKGGRVMCEDIASGKYDRKDFDYNDVVFDAIIYQKKYVLVTTTLDNSNNVISTSGPELNYTQEDGMPDPNYTSHYANIRLMAAGGTIPLQIIANGHNFEVHNMLGGKATTVMINTLHKDEREVVNMAEVDSATPVDLMVDGSKDIEGIERIQDIGIAVKYSQASAKIDAIPGRASAKILVPLGTRWAKERTDISDVYTKFSEWVTNEDAIGNRAWTTNVNTSGMYDDLEGLTMPENSSMSSTSIWKKEYSSGSAVSTTNATNTFMATPAGTRIYDYTTSGAGYLYDGSSVTATSSASITAGSKIRIYGVSIADWEVKCNNQTKSQSTESSYATNGYIEFDITQDLSNSLAITGKNFTITYVTVIGATPATKPGQIWPESGTGNDVNVSMDTNTASAKFANATPSQKLCIYSSSTSGWIQFAFGWWPVLSTVEGFSAPAGWWIDTDPSAGQGKVIKPSDGSFRNGRFEIELSQVSINTIKAQGFAIQGTYTITNITIE